MKLTDEQMLEVLREAGHEESATALEQKMTAARAVAGGGQVEGGGQASSPPAPATRPPAAGDAEPTGVDRMARAYADARKAGA